MFRSNALLALALLATACTPEIPEGRLLCADDADCPGSWSCDLGISRCVSHAVDAGGGDDGGNDCDPGYAPSADGCIDINECLAQGTCGPGGQCTNLFPGYSCVCGPGYDHPVGEPSCEDIHECAAFKDDCDWLGSCVDSDGSFSCSCPAGYSVQGHRCESTCDAAADVDSGALHFAVVDFGISDTGFDLDGLNNAQKGLPSGAGNGTTIAGCGRVDAPYGVDNGLGNLADSLFGTIDLDQLFRLAVVNGDLTIALDVAKLVTGGGANDPCVSVTLTMDGTTIVGRGAMTDHVLTIDFANPITFSVPFVLPPGSCNGGACNASELSFTLRAVKARLVLNAAHTTVLEGTLGGFVFSFDPLSAYDAYTATSQDAYVTSWATQSNAMTSVAQTIGNAFLSGRDLHMNADGPLAPCNGSSTNSTDRNAMSAAFSLVDP